MLRSCKRKFHQSQCGQLLVHPRISIVLPLCVRLSVCLVDVIALDHAVLCLLTDDAVQCVKSQPAIFISEFSGRGAQPARLCIATSVQDLLGCGAHPEDPPVTYPGNIFRITGTFRQQPDALLIMYVKRS